MYIYAHVNIRIHMHTYEYIAYMPCIYTRKYLYWCSVVIMDVQNTLLLPPYTSVSCFKRIR